LNLFFLSFNKNYKLEGHVLGSFGSKLAEVLMNGVAVLWTEERRLKIHDGKPMVARTECWLFVQKWLKIWACDWGISRFVIFSLKLTEIGVMVWCPVG
jgi:hypothetical protein